MAVLQQQESHSLQLRQLNAVDLSVAGKAQALLMRWRKLSYLACGLLLLPLALVGTHLFLVHARLESAMLLQADLSHGLARYTQQVDMLHDTANLWHQKQAAMQLWQRERQISQAPYQYLLLAQQLARRTHGRLELLVWSGSQLHLTMVSNSDWQSIQQAIDDLPWVSLQQVERTDHKQQVTSSYRYRVTIKAMGLD